MAISDRYVSKGGNKSVKSQSSRHDRRWLPHGQIGSPIREQGMLKKVKRVLLMYYNISVTLIFLGN